MGALRRKAAVAFATAAPAAAGAAQAHLHLACEIVDDLVMHHLLVQAIDDRGGNVLAARSISRVIAMRGIVSPEPWWKRGKYHARPVGKRHCSTAGSSWQRRARRRLRGIGYPGPAYRTAQVGSISICRGNGLLNSS
jgi:hypothetical protein